VAVIDGEHMRIQFFGVRGSTPCDGEELARYGGNTSCVAVEVPGHQPIMLDMGTGARKYGYAHDVNGRFDGVCLLTHLHWDHVQGLPFFPPTLHPGTSLELHGPRQEGSDDFREVFEAIWCPPAFPIGVADLPGEFTFHGHHHDDFRVGDVTVKARPVPHVGSTLGYRLDWQGRSIAYISDHQQPLGGFSIPDSVRELCDGVDVLIHDAQYTPDEFAAKSTWGHCTVEFAVWVGVTCGAKQLVMFHHDPTHDDAMIDRLRDGAAACCSSAMQVHAAMEGMTIDLGGPAGS